jgi:hypothetical protein
MSSRDLQKLLHARVHLYVQTLLAGLLSIVWTPMVLRLGLLVLFFYAVSLFQRSHIYLSSYRIL